MAPFNACRKLDSAPSSDAFESVARLSSLAVAVVVVVGAASDILPTASPLPDDGVHWMQRRFRMRRAGL